MTSENELGAGLGAGAIQATTLSEADLAHLLEQLGGGRSSPGLGGRFGTLYERIREREGHLFNSSQVDPKFSQRHGEAQPWQTDLPRRTWAQLRQRLTEHPLRVHVEPPDDSPASRRAADDLEHVLEQGLHEVEERSHLAIQADLGYGQVCLCYGVLHWRSEAERIPPLPAPELRATRPDTPQERNRFRLARPDEDAPLAWIEREWSRSSRDRQAQAAAGFPWHVEVIRPDQFAFVEDFGPGNGLGVAVVLREVGVMEYRDRLREQDGLALRISAARGEPSLSIAPAVDAPLPEEPSGSQWGQRLRLASVWTREEYYELAALGEVASSPSGKWTLIKSHAHPYEMAPFAIAEADTNDHPDIVRRWEPTMEGVYRAKPTYDYERSLGRFLAEQVAIPMYWVQLSDGGFQTDEDDKRVELTASAVSAHTLPEGASLHRVEFEINPAFVDFVRMSQEELFAAAPDTGAIERGEIGPNTQPHTLNLLLGSRNLQVQQLKRAQARAVRTMLRNMALVMSKPLSAGGFGAPVWVFAPAPEGAGRRQRREPISVEPSVIPSLDIDVWVDPYSASQRIAVQEHGRARLNDPLDPLDQRGYLEEYIGEEHAVQALERHRRWRIDQARLDAHIDEIRGVQEASNGARREASFGRLPQHLSPLGRLAQADDDRTAGPPASEAVRA